MSLLLLARTRGHTAASDRAVRAFSRTGEHGACWFALGLAGAAKARITGGDDGAWRAGIKAVATGYAANYAVKLAIRRERPDLPGLPPLSPTVSRLSFPSAHCTTSFAAACVYSHAAPAMKPALYATALAFAVSRPYLGVHYPSDVLAGAIMGTVIGALACR